MPFQDYFSQQAEQYARHRPSYPEALYDYLASLAPGRNLAWDCGAGNGQVAVALAGRFRRVIATDASAQQIAQAFPHERVDYRVEQAEATSIEPGSVDLVTVGTAVHWFDFDGFYAEVRRVGRAAAVVAVWTYHLPHVEPTLDQWLEAYYRQTLAGYWPERIRYLEERYRTLPFPFAEIAPPPFVMETSWDLDCMVGFLASWSATRKYLEDQGPAAFQAQIDGLRRLWGDGSLRRTVRWPLHFRIGRLP